MRVKATLQITMTTIRVRIYHLFTSLEWLQITMTTIRVKIYHLFTSLEWLQITMTNICEDLSSIYILGYRSP